MALTAEKVMKDARGLPPELRAFVAEKLIESLDVPAALPLSAKWKKEVRKRCAEMDRGCDKASFCQGHFRQGMRRACMKTVQFYPDAEAEMIAAAAVL